MGLTLDLQWQQGNIYYPLNIALNETKLSSNKSLTPYDVLASLGKINKAQKKSKKSKSRSKHRKDSEVEQEEPEGKIIQRIEVSQAAPVASHTQNQPFEQRIGKNFFFGGNNFSL